MYEKHIGNKILSTVRIGKEKSPKIEQQQKHTSKIQVNNNDTNFRSTSSKIISSMAGYMKPWSGEYIPFITSDRKLHFLRLNP